MKDKFASSAHIQTAEAPSIFSKIFSERTEEFIFENDSFFSIFDTSPVSPGHTLVIPKRQIVSFNDLNEREWIDLKAAIEGVMKSLEGRDLIEKYKMEMTQVKAQFDTLNSALNAASEAQKKKISRMNKRVFYLQTTLKKLSELKSVKITGFNIGLNDGRSAGRTIDHLHWHIIPRFDGDVVHPEGGVRNIFPELGNYTK